MPPARYAEAIKVLKGFSFVDFDARHAVVMHGLVRLLVAAIMRSEIVSVAIQAAKVLKAYIPQWQQKNSGPGSLREHEMLNVLLQIAFIHTALHLEIAQDPALLQTAVVDLPESNRDLLGTATIYTAIFFKAIEEGGNYRQLPIPAHWFKWAKFVTREQQDKPTGDHVADALRQMIERRDSFIWPTRAEVNKLRLRFTRSSGPSGGDGPDADTSS